MSDERGTMNVFIHRSAFSVHHFVNSIVGLGLVARESAMSHGDYIKPVHTKET